MSKFFCAALALLSLAAPVQSASYPERPIRMIAPSSPGGPNDVIARAVSTPMADLLGKQIVIDNRAGAAGLIGTDIVAKAIPDGYTLLFGFSGPLSIVPNLVKSVPYDPVRDFSHISLEVPIKCQARFQCSCLHVVLCEDRFHTAVRLLSSSFLLHLLRF